MAFHYQLFWGNRSTTRWSEIMWTMSLLGLIILLCVYNVRPAKVLIGCNGDGRKKLFSADTDVNPDHLNFTVIATTTGTIRGITHNPNTQDIYFTEDGEGIQKCDINTMTCQRIISDLTAVRGITVYKDMLYYVDDSDNTIYKTNGAGQKENIYTYDQNIYGIDIDRRDSMIYFIDTDITNRLISFDMIGHGVTRVLSGIGELRNVEIDQTARDVYIGTDDSNNATIIKRNLDTNETNVLYDQGTYIHDISILDEWILYLEYRNGLKVLNMSGIPHPVTVRGIETCTQYRSIHVIDAWNWTLNIDENFRDVQEEEELLSAFETFTSFSPATLGTIVNYSQIEMVKYKLHPIEKEFLGDREYDQPLTVSLTAAFVNAERNNASYVTIAVMKTPNRVIDYHNDIEHIIASPLLSINFFHETGNLVRHENKQHPFNVTFPILQLNETLTLNQSRRVCSFWDNEHKHWSQDGSITFEELSTAPYQTCAFTHLTTFAVLFDFSKDDNREYSSIAEIFSIIGSSISVIALCIGLGIFACLWRRPPIDKEKMVIHCQLMVVMVIAYLLNMVSKSAKSQENRPKVSCILQKFQQNTACLVFAILRYNMFLNMFSIMFIEAVHLFRMIVIVFGGQRNVRAIYAAITFGIPILLTIITASIGQDQLHDEQSCWLARKYIWSFIAPVATLLTANVLILVSVVRQTLMVAAQDRIQSARIGLRSTLLLLPMLGISWLVAFLANLSLVATYMFDIIISLQGTYLVVVIFVINSEVRNATLEWFRANMAEWFRTNVLALQQHGLNVRNATLEWFRANVVEWFRENVLARQRHGLNVRRVQVQPAPPDATIDTTD